MGELNILQHSGRKVEYVEEHDGLEIEKNM